MGRSEAVQFCSKPCARTASNDSRKLLFTPRHDFLSLDAGALRENYFCPIPRVASSEIRPLCATLALVSGKRPAWFKARIVQLAHQFLATVLSPMLRRWAQSV